MEERDMKLKGIFLVLAFACLSAAAAAAAPKVAVLDAVLPEKMDINVAIGVTEKISEELVGSGKFTVLDRTTVGQSLKEIEFQMSGMVSDEQIKKAGEQLNSRLGAAYVVVSRVSVVGDTYFVTAKMIDIKTGEITAQASSEQEGKVAITLKIAQVVGKKLAGGVKEPAAAVKTELAEEKPPAKEKPPAAEEPPAAPKRLHSRIALFASLPTFAGTSEDAITASISGVTFSAVGAGLHWMQFLWKGLYATAFLNWANEDVTDGIDTLSVQQVLDAQVGVGWGFGFGPNMQLAVGFHGGYMSTTAGSYWFDEGTTYDGVGYGAEINYDWVILKSLALSARLDLTAGTMGTSIDEAYFAFMLGLGWAY
jgi:TolB-like protein